MSFNPYRVFKFAATSQLPGGVFDGILVSIPIGFSSSLQQYNEDWGWFTVKCFNPYRVFKFAATSPIRPRKSYLLGFNPYRVFKFAATPSGIASAECWQKCFNPYRVFKFAATKYVAWGGRTHKMCFNPYRVFKFAATPHNRWTPHVPESFNPYRVFKFAATFLFVRCQFYPGSFQSLSGFQVRCNAAKA